jgi:ribosome-binding protein aMBF1 (putative translation factor)
MSKKNRQLRITRPAATIPRMSPHKRKNLNPDGALNERFGLHLQGLIETAGLSISELSKRLGISEQAIRNWTRGQRYPSPEMMERLAGIFELADYRHVLPKPARRKQKK